MDNCGDMYTLDSKARARGLPCIRVEMEEMGTRSKMTRDEDIVCSFDWAHCTSVVAVK